MKRCILTMIAAAGVLTLSLAAVAEEGDAVLSGESSVGAHYLEATGGFGKVGEYLSDVSEGKFQGHGFFSLSGATDANLFEIDGFFRDRDTKAFGLKLDTDGRVSARFDYISFVHNLDHDLLLNMQAREATGDGSPAGKMVFHTDMDPTGRYRLDYENFDAEVEYDLTSIRNGKLYVRYGDQHKSGWRQTMTLDHCAYCHVESNAREIDEQTRTWVAGAEGTLGALTFNYEFEAQDFTDFTDPNRRHWQNAQHPTRGLTHSDDQGNIVANYGVEFGSRLGFEDVTLPYAAGPTSEKRAHDLGLKLDVNASNTVRGSYSHNRVENLDNGLNTDFDAIAAGWVARPGRKTRLTARVVTYEVKADDAFVDLAPYRENRPGGGQDFDWTRISAANRNVLQTDVNARHRLGRTATLNLGWRHKVVERDAMAQSQTTYSYDEATGDDVLHASTPYANETTTDRFRAVLSKRFGRQGNARLAYTYVTASDQFMNPTAMCEEGLHEDGHALDGNANVYYFQRERLNPGTSLPTESHKVAFRGTYRVSPRFSLNGFFNVASESNDELDHYEFERTVVSPGVNLWFAPSAQLMFTAGYAFNSVESNAVLCPPLFGG